MKTLTALLTSLLLLAGVFTAPLPVSAAKATCCAAPQCCCVQPAPASSAPLTPAPAGRASATDQTQLLPSVAVAFVLQPVVENPTTSAPLSLPSSPSTPLYQRNCSYLL